MLDDIKLSTILLIVIVLFLIYSLMNSSESSEETEPTEEVDPVEPTEPTEPTGVDPTKQNETFANISPELVNQVLAESENKMGVSKGEGSIFNYEPNDNDKSFGAALEVAFEKTIGPTEKTDEIDFKKNNNKNYDAKDFLPKEINDDWFNTDFSQAKYNINDDKLINTEKYIIGINTVGQSLKNASYDIRGSVNVPKFSVSPWNNSTTEADYNIKPLC